MGFKTSNTNTNKNAVVLSLTSKTTGNKGFWLNMTDQMARDVFKKEVRDITAQDVIDKNIAKLIEEGYFELTVTDITEERPTISPEEF